MSAPTLDAVHIPFATYPDSTVATLPVMTGSRVRSGVVLGSAGSGKSTLLDAVAAQLPGHGIQPWRVSAREADPTTVWHTLSSELHRRSREVIAGHEPEPVLLLVDDAAWLDTWFRVDSAAATMLPAAQKLGLGLLLATDEPTQAGFGGSARLRATLLAHGTVLLLRHTGSGLGWLPQYTGQPASTLPRACGQGYTLTGPRPHAAWTVPAPH